MQVVSPSITFLCPLSLDLLSISGEILGDILA